MPDPVGLFPDPLPPEPVDAAHAEADPVPDPPVSTPNEDDLAAREAALAVRERQFAARSQLTDMGLSPDLMKHFDFSSDEALDRSLALAVTAASAARSPASVPPATLPPFPRVASYADRVRLWQIDPQGYKTAIADAEQRI